MNIRLAKEVIAELLKLGVKEFCLCPGGRNSPFVVLLEQMKENRTFRFFEERSAAFFAVGRIKNHGGPVAVVTTSGSAAAELLPALMEAFYSGLPLILVTADRPRSYRGTGAPQSALQVGLYSHYVQKEIDIEVGEKIDLVGWNCKTPLHINVCFDEPLIDENISFKS
ncbi:MAG: hypothetical protein A2W61_02435 [Deltaproteobacteria bacterium RIFCSPLOWO2_01_44_7]|nr:MAG: hypothetical protein A2W61_02435 [Deltaproteobacteria bacterium RIFCSPLOWO2_01_44_7]